METTPATRLTPERRAEIEALLRYPPTLMSWRETVRPAVLELLAELVRLHEEAAALREESQ